MRASDRPGTASSRFLVLVIQDLDAKNEFFLWQCFPFPRGQQQSIFVRVGISERVGLPNKFMPYGFIALIAAIALTGVFVWVTEAAVWCKALVVGLLLLSFRWHYGLFLQVAIAISLSLYFTYLKARYSGEGKK